MKRIYAFTSEAMPGSPSDSCHLSTVFPPCGRKLHVYLCCGERGAESLARNVVGNQDVDLVEATDAMGRAAPELARIRHNDDLPRMGAHGARNAGLVEIGIHRAG